MTLTHLLRRSLIFHRRGNLAVLLGVAVGTAVLTGALLVGDSLRGSLRDRALRQLDGIDAAMLSGRFLRQEIADRLTAETGGEVRPVLLFRGTIATENGHTERVTLIGVGAEKIMGIQMLAALPVWQPSWRIWEWVPAF